MTSSPANTAIPDPLPVPPSTRKVTTVRHIALCCNRKD